MGRVAPKRVRTLGVVLVTLLAGACLAGWFSPWGVAFRYERASLLALRRMTLADPQNRLAWRTMGLRLARHGDAALAEPALRQALALDPADTEVATALGEILMARRAVDEAFQILKAAVAQRPDDPLPRMALGRLYRRRGAYHHAAEQFEAVASRRRDFPDAWYELAVCYLQMQQVARAKEAIGRALQQFPQEPEYLALKAAVEAAVGEVDAALGTMARASALAPNDIRIQTRYAALLLAHQRGEDDLRQAERLIARLEAAAAPPPLLPYLKGRLAVYRRDWPSAIALLEEARRVTPEQDEVYYALSQAYRRTGRSADAEAALALYRRRQDLRRRIDELRIRIGIEPNNLALHERLAELQQRIGDRIGALASLERAVEIAPKRDDLRRRLEALQRQARRVGG